MPISLVQNAYNTNPFGMSISATYASVQVPGNLNIIAIGWNDITSTITSVSDTSGNTYSQSVGIFRSTSIISQSIWHCANIVGATAGSNVVTITFDATVPSSDIRISEWNGMSTTNPVVYTSGSGASAALVTPGITTINDNDLLFVAGTTTDAVYALGAGFTILDITPFGDVHGYEIVSSIGSYFGSALQSNASEYVLQLVAFQSFSASNTANYAVISDDGSSVQFTQMMTDRFISMLESQQPGIVILPINMIPQPSFTPSTQTVIQSGWTIGPVDVQPIWTILPITSAQLIAYNAQLNYDAVLSGLVVDAFTAALSTWGNKNLISVTGKLSVQIGGSVVLSGITGSTGLLTASQKDVLLGQLLASVNAILQYKFGVQH